MMPGQPMPTTGASFRPSFSASCDVLLQHVDEAADRLVALRLLVAVTPQVGGEDGGLRKILGLFQLGLDDAGADVGAADVDGENAVVPLQHPGRHQVRSADEAGLVGMIAG